MRLHNDAPRRSTKGKGEKKVWSEKIEKILQTSSSPWWMSFTKKAAERVVRPTQLLFHFSEVIYRAVSQRKEGKNE
jgi:hypothetical protein